MGLKGQMEQMELLAATHSDQQSLWLDQMKMLLMWRHSRLWLLLQELQPHSALQAALLVQALWNPSDLVQQAP